MATVTPYSGPPDKTQLRSHSDITTLLGIAGKTITSVDQYRHGMVEVTDILCTDASHYYIKTRQGAVDIGGTSDWGSGTRLGGR